MAARFFVNGGVDNNWSTIGNWSLTSGGTGGEAVPTASDDVAFDSNSPNCTVNTSNRVCKTLNFTGYTGTITMTMGITVSGSVTLVSAMAIAGTGFLAVNATGTLTSNAVAWPNALNIGGTSQTYTLADAWTVTGLITANGTTATTVAGTFSITANGGFTSTVASFILSTGTLILGGGTWNSNGVVFTGNVTFAGNVTVSGNVSWRTGTMLYSSGTITTTSSTLTMTAAGTLNTNGIIWNNFTASGTITITLSSDLTLTGTLTLGTTTLTTTINGAFNINAKGNVTLSGSTAIIAGTATIIMNGTSNQTLSTPSSTQIKTNFKIDSTGGTITMPTQLQYSTGTFTYLQGTVTAGGLYNMALSVTLNTSGMNWTTVYFYGTATVTLTSDLNCGNLNLGQTTLTTTINGAFNINATGNVNVGSSGSGTTAIVTGTATIVMTGTGTLSTTSSCQLKNSLKFNSSSGTITIGFTNYNTGTVTWLAGTMSVSASQFWISGSCTLNTSGMTFGGFSITGTTTVTLTSDLNISGTLALGGTTLTTTLNGAFNINAGGNVTLGGTTAIVTGTANIQMNGTGTLSMPSGVSLRTNFEINTSGTVTLSGTILYGNRIWKYTAGTVVTTGSTMSFGALGGSNTVTINNSGLTFNNITVAQGTTFNGTNGFTTANFTCTTVGITISWGNGKTYLITGVLTLTGTAASNIIMNSDSAGNRATLTLENNGTASHDVGFVQATDIDSAAGLTIWHYKGSQSNTVNWNQLAIPVTSSSVFEG